MNKILMRSSLDAGAWTQPQLHAQPKLHVHVPPLITSLNHSLYGN